MSYYEKLAIWIVLFLGLTIGTSAIIGNYVKATRGNNNQNTIILENINFF